MSNETELRHAVIDRLIAASLRDTVLAREADIKNWREISAKPPAAAPVSAAPVS